MDFLPDDICATVNSFGGVDYAAMNKGITPLFFMETVTDERATADAGTLRTIDLERVRLMTAGDPLSAPVAPVDDSVKERFAEQYARWQAKRTNDFIAGTPLKAWPLVSKGFVMEMEALHIRSVEDLAAVSDANIARIMDGRVWRDKAAAWLESGKNSGAAAKFAEEAARLRDENSAMRKDMEAMTARMNAIEMAGDEPAKRGPGRPRAA